MQIPAEEEQLSIIFQLRLLKALLALLTFYISLRILISNGFGAAGAFTWAFSLLLACAGVFGFVALSPWTLPILACIAGITMLIAYSYKDSKAGLLFELRRFLLQVCGPAGATYFTLAWLGLMFAAAALPMSLMFAVSGLVAVCAILVVYTEGSKPGLLHSFISKVLGAGGATYWFLEFVAFVCAVTFPPLVFIIVPAVIIAAAGVLWHSKNSDAVNTACLSCFSWQTTGQPQIESKEESQAASGILHREALIASL